MHLVYPFLRYLSYCVCVVSCQIYTGRFFKNQQIYAKLIQLFTSAWRNKNIEIKEKIRQDVV